MSDAKPPRIKSYAEFWPYYLGEHAVPTCRMLHFAGTTLVLSLLVATLVSASSTHPLWIIPAVIGAAAFGFLGHVFVEKKRAAFLPILLFIACLAPLHPAYVVGAVFAGYGFAWPAHFLVEKNRPATFQYPMWSLASDFRMWGNMLMGRLWRGHPLEQINASASTTADVRD